MPRIPPAHLSHRERARILRKALIVLFVGWGVSSVSSACRTRAYNADTRSTDPVAASAPSSPHTIESARTEAAACGGTGPELVLCGGVPHLFVACDDSALAAGQPGCTPPGAKRGRFYFYVLENGQPRATPPLFTDVVRMREEVLGAPSGKEATRPCGEAFDAILGSRSAYTLRTPQAGAPPDLHAIDCHVEINTRLNGQVTVSVVPLLPAWTMPEAIKVPDFRAQPLNPLVARNPWNARYGIPADAPALAGKTLADGELLYAMLDVRLSLAPFEKQVEACLKNSRARGNLDLQHHYYCQLPKDPYRACLGGRIAAYRLEPACAGKAPNVEEAIAFCFEKSDLKTEAGVPALFFREPGKEWRVKAFRDAFLVARGVKDFDVGQENAIVDAFAAALGVDRPRRVVDTWPKWTPEQPRYVAAWTAQEQGRRRLPSRPEVCTTPPTVQAQSED